MLVCAACAPDAGNSRITGEYGTDGRLTKLSFDRDGNGAVDTWGYMDGARVVRVEVDENGDGKPDRWEYHSEGGRGEQGAGAPGSRVPTSTAAPDKTIERIERATRHDGRVTRREFFEQGLLVRVEEDTDADSRMDKWETYVNGALSMIALDTEHRGTPDRRMIYGADGSFVRVEVDPAGTGSFAPVTP